MWIRFGYDPRKHPDAKIYQVLDFRIRCGMKYGKNKFIFCLCLFVSSIYSTLLKKKKNLCMRVFEYKHVCVHVSIPVHTLGGQKRGSGVLCHFPPSSLRQNLFVNLGLTFSQPAGSPQASATLSLVHRHTGRPGAWVPGCLRDIQLAVQTLSPHLNPHVCTATSPATVSSPLFYSGAE